MPRTKNKSAPLVSAGAGNGDAALAERGGQRTILLAEKVRQLRMKQRNGQTQQDAGKFHKHGMNLSGDGGVRFHR